MKLNSLIKDGNANRLYKRLEELVSCGNRYAGSKADNLAADYVGKSFLESNMEVIEEVFTGHLFEEIDSYVEIGEVRYESRAMFYSVSSEGEIEAEAVYLGYGEESDYEGKDLNNKIVVLTRGEHKDDFWHDVSKASQNGAVGFILVNYHNWQTITTLETGYFDPEKRLMEIEPKNLPSLVLGREDGENLIEQINLGKKVKIMADVFNGEREAKNIRAIKKGSVLPEEKIVIYGHRDTVGVPGANDNGSGNVIMLEVAEMIKDLDLKRSVEFISFSAEEHLGSLGSIAYLEKHRDQLKNITASIELDMVGVGKIYVMSGGAWKEKDIHFSEELTDYVLGVTEELGYRFEKDFSNMGTPDSGRFANYEVPTTWIWSPDDIHYHSPLDTIEKVEINNLKMISDVIATAINDLANK